MQSRDHRADTAPEGYEPRACAGNLLHFSQAKCNSCPVRGNALCGAAGPRAGAELARMGHLRRLGPDQTLFAEGEDEAVALVRSGILRLQYTNVEGRRTIPAMVFPGEFAGRLYGAEAHCAVEAATEAEICVYDRRALERLLRTSPELERSLMAAASDKLDRILHSTWVLMSLNVEERIAGYLLLLAALSRQPGDPADLVRLDMPRRDIADHLGTSVETISRVLHTMVRKGLIALEARRIVRLLDRPAMEAATGLDAVLLDSMVPPRTLPEVSVLRA